MCSTVSDDICNIKERETGHSYNLDRSIDGVFSTEEAHEYCCILETHSCNDVKEWFEGRGEVSVLNQTCSETPICQGYDTSYGDNFEHLQSFEACNSYGNCLGGDGDPSECIWRAGRGTGSVFEETLSMPVPSMQYAYDPDPNARSN